MLAANAAKPIESPDQPNAETTEQTGASQAASHRGRPKTRTGIVTSNKMQKTVVVTVRRRAAHRKYGKILTLREKYKAHVEDHDYPKNPTLPPARTSAGGWSRCSSAGRASKDGGRP